MSQSFAPYLTEHIADINRLMATYFRGKASSPDLERYLYGPLAHFTENGGKRIRPAICMLAAGAVGGDPARAARTGAAIELFQSAALIHDDIADHGELRRGEPCLYRTEGVGLATNCGDLALSYVTGAVLADEGLDDACKVRVLRELTAMTERTIEGQALDLGWVRDGRFDITIDDYLTMATLKTAHYSAAVPLAAGAIVGGGDDSQVEALRAFGLYCGLAFQIQDDLLNLIGSAADKDHLSDITEGKRTLVAVHALADPAVHDEVEAILRAGTSDRATLERTVDIFRSTGSIDFARDHALALIARAKGHLADIELEPQGRALLLSMADFFVERLS